MIVHIEQKGQSANMLKVGTKRRRTQAQIKADKEAAALREQELQAKIVHVSNAEAKLADYENMQANFEKAKALMLELQRQGHIDIDDNWNVSPSKQKPRDEFQDFGHQ